MKIRTTLFAFGSVLLISMSMLFAQELQNKSGFGFDGGGNYLFGDAAESVPGFSAGITLAFRFTERMSLNVNTGYGTIGFKTNTAAQKSVSNFIYSNLTLDYELKGGSFRPFLLAGAGGVNFRPANSPDRFYDGEVLAGAGMRIFLSKNMAFSISASGNYTTGDELDGIKVGGKDIYAAIRTGFTFYKTRQPSDRFDRDDYFTDQMLWDETNVDAAEDEPVDYFNDTLLNSENKLVTESNAKKEQQQAKYGDANIDNIATETSLADTAGAKNKATDQSDAWLFSAFENADANKPAEHLQPSTMQNAPFKIVYEDALQAYRNRNYLDAIEKFEALVARDPDHNLASNCEYWIGECYYGLAQYEKAAITFERVLNAYLVSPKMDDALIMQGLAYMKLGKYAEAGMAFNRLLTMYPDSEYAPKAQKYLKKLRA